MWRFNGCDSQSLGIANLSSALRDNAQEFASYQRENGGLSPNATLETSGRDPAHFRVCVERTILSANMSGRTSRFTFVWLAALVTLAAHSCCALDNPRSFLRIDKTERREAVLTVPAIKVVSTGVTFNGVQSSRDAKDRLRQLVEKATNKTAAEEDALLDEIVPQIVDIIVSAVAESVVAAIVSALGGTPGGPLEQIVSITVLAVAGAVVTAIVTAILGSSGGRRLATDAFCGGHGRRLQLDTLLEGVIGQIIEIVVVVVADAVVSAISGVLGGALSDPVAGIAEELVSVVVMAVASALVSAILLVIFGGGELASLLSSRFDRNLQSTDANTTVTDVGQVEEETISAIVSAIVSAVVSLIVGAIIQAIVQSILGILGIAPASDGPAERVGNRTFTKADLNALTASLNNSAVPTAATNDTNIPTNFMKVVSAGPDALIATVAGAAIDAIFELLASPDGDLSLNGILSRLNLGNSIAVVAKTNAPATMLTKKMADVKGNVQGDV
jgi:hypothetical protein